MKKLLFVAAAAIMLTGCFKVNTPLSISPSSVTIAVGGTVSVSVSADGDAAAVTDLKSEDPSIATTSGTIITGRSAGHTRVYACQLDSQGKVIDTAYCEVTVEN